MKPKFIINIFLKTILTLPAKARIVVGYGVKGFETVDLTSKGGYFLVVAAPPAVGAGKGSESGVDMVLFFKVMED